MFEAHVVTHDYDGQETLRIVVRRTGVGRKIVLEVTRPNDCSLTRLECDGYELLEAIRAVL